MPARTFISVDLPAPFSPTRPSTSFSRRKRPTSSRAVTPGNRLTSPSTSNATPVHWPVTSSPGGGRCRVAWSLNSPLLDNRHAGAVHRQRDGNDDQQALHRLLDVRVDPHQDHSVAERGDEQHTDERLQDAAAA